MDDGHDADDWESISLPPLPPDDRLWMHPSEVGHSLSAPLARRQRPSVGTALVSASLGALVMLTVLAAAGLVVGFDHASDDFTAAAKSSVTERAPASDSSPMESVVTLQVERPSGTAMAPGVALNAHGDIVVSAASIAGATGLAMLHANGPDLPASQTHIDPASDLAVVHVEGVRTIASAHPVEPRLHLPIALTASDPLDRGHICNGTISAVNETLSLGSSHTPARGQLILTMSRGMSSAAVVTAADGSGLVGIINPRWSRQDNSLVYATPIDVALRIGHQLIETGRVAAAELEITFAPQSSDPAKTALRVLGVTPGSSADLAGIMAGDSLIQVARRPVQTADDVIGALGGYRPGDVVQVQIERGGLGKHLEVTLGALPTVR